MTSGTEMWKVKSSLGLWWLSCLCLIYCLYSTVNTQHVEGTPFWSEVGPQIKGAAYQ